MLKTKLLQALLEVILFWNKCTSSIAWGIFFIMLKNLIIIDFLSLKTKSPQALLEVILFWNKFTSSIGDISIIGGVNQREFCPFYQGFPKYFAIRFKERKQRKLYDRDWTSHFLELFNVRILRVYFERGKQTFLFAYHVCFSYHGCNVESLGICWKKIRFSKRKNYIFRICAKKKSRVSLFTKAP